jgi:uncharacterized Ntn-hydrolase superfamily protein
VATQSLHNPFLAHDGLPLPAEGHSEEMATAVRQLPSRDDPMGEAARQALD